jgi:hypothetical protein
MIQSGPNQKIEMARQILFAIVSIICILPSQASLWDRLTTLVTATPDTDSLQTQQIRHCSSCPNCQGCPIIPGPRGAAGANGATGAAGANGATGAAGATGASGGGGGSNIKTVLLLSGSGSNTFLTPAQSGDVIVLGTLTVPPGLNVYLPVCNATTLGLNYYVIAGDDFEPVGGSGDFTAWTITDAQGTPSMYGVITNGADVDGFSATHQISTASILFATTDKGSWLDFTCAYGGNTFIYAWYVSGESSTTDGWAIGP